MYIYRKGFSLAELSGVIIIISILIGASLGMLDSSNDVAKRQQTINKMKVIEDALTAFVAVNNRLPCPANLLLDVYTDSNAGIESCNNANHFVVNGIALPATDPGPGTNTSLCKTQVQTGAVPFATLKLPKEFALDGWTKKIMYSVSSSISGTSTGNYGTPTIPYLFSGCYTGLIKIKSIFGTTITDRAATGLLSYGSNMYGSFSAGAISALTSRFTSPPASNTNETTNMDQTNNGYIIVMGEPTSIFDDIVSFKTKDQYLFELKRPFAETYCTMAITQLISDDTSFNSQYYNTLCGGTTKNVNCGTYVLNLLNLLRSKCLNYGNNY